MQYKIVIYPSRKGTVTSANVWIVLSGTLGETQHISVPRGSLNFDFRVIISTIISWPKIFSFYSFSNAFHNLKYDNI